MEEIYEKVATAYARNLDDTIKTLVTDRLGYMPEMLDLAKRCTMMQWLNKPEKVLLLDGMPLIEIYPSEMRVEAEGESVMMKFVTAYRTFKQN